MQLFRLRLAQSTVLVSDTDCRHGWIGGGLELRMRRSQGVKVFCLAHVVIDPFADLACPVPLEAHPYLQAAKTPRLLEAMHVELVTLVGFIQFVGEIGGLHAE